MVIKYDKNKDRYIIFHEMLPNGRNRITYSKTKPKVSELKTSEFNF